MGATRHRALPRAEGRGRRTRHPLHFCSLLCFLDSPSPMYRTGAASRYSLGRGLERTSEALIRWARDEPPGNQAPSPTTPLFKRTPTWDPGRGRSLPSERAQAEVRPETPAHALGAWVSPKSLVIRRQGATQGKTKLPRLVTSSNVRRPVGCRRLARAHPDAPGRSSPGSEAVGPASSGWRESVRRFANKPRAARTFSCARPAGPINAMT
jgi:hypothetical protein